MAKKRKGKAGKRIRAAIRHAAFTSMPARITKGAVTRLKSVRRIHSVEREIIMPNLPDACDGLTITHLSDLHIGDLIPTQRLPEIIEKANRFESDLIAVTGDFIDLKHDVLDQVLDAVTELRAPLGVYMVLGNHDHLVNGRRVAHKFSRRGLNLLMNEHLTITHREHKIMIAGIDWAHQAHELDAHVRRCAGDPTTNGEYDLRLLLAHHPHAWDTACLCNFDLTLAGHTHGGQFNFFRSKARQRMVGLADFAFRYPQGLYQRGTSHLHVTTGVGSWFPLRFRCPAEMVQLKLKSYSTPVVDISHP